MGFPRFLWDSTRYALKGGRYYYAWLGALAVLSLAGLVAYLGQVDQGLIVTAMRDQVSWGFYIGNFTFLVGVAAAAVLLVIPAYVYQWKPIKEIAILGEVLAISAIVMCLLFVMVDIGRPDRFWHLFPVVGKLHFPASLLAWDFLVLNGYLLLNVVLVGFLLFAGYRGEPYNRSLVHPLILLSIPAAISIHTVTAFLYNGFAARPFWTSSILAPRFLASAFCSGPAILVIAFQILQRTTRFEIKDEAIWKIAELMAYAMAINLFLLGAELFKEFYWQTHHSEYATYLWFGLEGHNALVPYAWASLACSLVAFVLLLIPSTRQNLVTLNIGCLLVYAGVYIEKGMGLVIPGLTPSTLGDIYEYGPTWTEVSVGAGIFAIGFLVFTVLAKVSIGVMLGDVRSPRASGPETAPLT